MIGRLFYIFPRQGPYLMSLIYIFIEDNIERTAKDIFFAVSGVLLSTAVEKRQ